MSFEKITHTFSWVIFSSGRGERTVARFARWYGTGRGRLGRREGGDAVDRISHNLREEDRVLISNVTFSIRTSFLQVIYNSTALRELIHRTL